MQRLFATLLARIRALIDGGLPVTTDPEYSAVDTVARTLWGEARGEGRQGMEAVACVIQNRVRYPRWWGHDWVSVCRAPWQFSCWNPDDPNLPKLEAVNGTDPAFVTALAIADDAVNGRLQDITASADSYYAIGSRMPTWAERAAHTCDIGHQAFYRTEIPDPRSEVTT